jgi:hypothetical protein
VRLGKGSDLVLRKDACLREKSLTEVLIEGGEELDARLHVGGADGLANAMHAPARNANIDSTNSCQRGDGRPNG